MPKQRLFEVVVQGCANTTQALRKFYDEARKARVRCSDTPVVDWQINMFDSSKVDAVVRAHVTRL